MVKFYYRASVLKSKHKLIALMLRALDNTNILSACIYYMLKQRSTLFKGG